MPFKKKSDKLETAGLKAADVKAKKQEKSKTKKNNILTRIGRWFARWFKELKSEAKKVNWPSFKSVVNNTLVVIAVVLMLGGLIVLIDLGLRNGLSLIVG